MDALLDGISEAWHIGGSGSTHALRLTCFIIHCYDSLAFTLTDNGQHNERLDRWALFVSDGEQRRCLQLVGRPQAVAIIGGQQTAAAASSSSSSSTQQHRHRAHAMKLLIEHQEVVAQFSRAGTSAAQSIMSVHSNHLANYSVCTLLVPEHSSSINIHVWREDVLQRLQTQLQLADAALVPLKVWRRVARTSFGEQLRNMPALTSKTVVAGLVCWHCGAMPAKLHQCGRCGLAWYCSKEHQRAEYNSGCHKRWCSGLADEVQHNASIKYRYMMADMVSALQRNPVAALLVHSPEDTAQFEAAVAQNSDEAVAEAAAVLERYGPGMVVHMDEGAVLACDQQGADLAAQMEGLMRSSEESSA